MIEFSTNKISHLISARDELNVKVKPLQPAKSQILINQNAFSWFCSNFHNSYKPNSAWFIKHDFQFVSGKSFQEPFFKARSQS